MIIIGLAGGKPCDRNEIAQRLVRSGGARLQAWQGSESTYTGARVRDLTAFLSEANRNRALGGLILTNVNTEQEAEEIRRHGGVMWHVMGAPSMAVPIRKGDPLVTHMQGGCRHFRDSLEQFSEHLLSIAAAH